MSRALGAAAGTLAGAVAGVVVTLGIVVARAHLASVFVHGLHELIDWPGLPLALGPLLGAWAGWRTPRSLLRVGAVGLLGLAAGIAVGVLIAVVAGAEPTGRWAAGIVGAAAGLLLGCIGAPLASRGRGPRRAEPAGRAAVLLACVGVLGTTGACQESPSPAEAPRGGELSASAPPADEPDPERVESVLVLLGDPGEARTVDHPILPRIRREVETWAGGLERDSAVAVVILGDLIYPEGLPPRDAPTFERDTLRLASQLRLVAGPVARRRGARAFLVAGNHDWGQREDWEGAVRLLRIQAFVDGWREAGVAASLRPEAGTGGPAVVDMGERLRLVLLDTAWWLLDAEPEQKEDVVEGVAEALRGAGDRRVVMAAHHPFESAGPHGGFVSVGRSLGIHFLLARSGALLQDLNSGPYRALRRALLEVFRRTSPPAVFAGGHEHSLQVIRPSEPHAPEVSLVSGSASRLTPVGPAPGLVFGASAPGYALLFVMEDGDLHLQLRAAPPRFLECPAPEAERRRCMEAGVEAFDTVWAGDI